MTDAKTIIKNWCAACGMPEPSEGECHALETALAQHHPKLNAHRAARAVQPVSNADELPGMWDQSDLHGGYADATVQPAAPQGDAGPTGNIKYWQALEALDELESSARGDEPINHFAAPLIRQYIEATVAALAAQGQEAEPAHWLAVLDPEQVEHQPEHRLHAAGFRRKRSAEAFIAEQADFGGWRYSLRPLYTHPPRAQADAPACDTPSFCGSVLRCTAMDERRAQADADKRDAERLSFLVEHWHAKLNGVRLAEWLADFNVIFIHGGLREAIDTALSSKKGGAA